ncbi:MAG: two-component system response regulator [Zetaproteobacteria bacterium CG_4_9_14_3_um_filter_53_7]|nr:MAG: two-component system response regulator [Zetaproteobacteria bacterium CG_4_9_14_3_um_filter_53_7]
MKVLIVDDNPTNVMLLKHMIQKLDGCEPICFTSSREGITWCEAGKPDLLLVDYMMPEIDGLEFIRRFRLIPHCVDIPVVMITAEEKKEVRYQALEAGANDFLNKPIDKTEFVARTNNMIRLRKNQFQLANRAEWLAKGIKKATEELRQQEREALLLLSKAAEYRDPETGAHLNRMSLYSKIIARNLGFGEEEQEIMLEASPMHDVGKVGTPDHILLKPGKLDPDEFEIMKQHASYGYDILKQGSSRLMQVAAEIAVTHHEKFNGRGYPLGLKGEDIPLRGRIVAVADVFDALTSERPYKKAWPLQEALDLLRRESGEHFDPQCVDAFLTSLDEVQEIMVQYHESF